MTFETGLPVKRKPRRNIGELGSFVVRRTDKGHVVEQGRSQVPKTKDEAEAFFGSIFVEEYNRTLPLGRDYGITLGRQNDTSERDFNIFSVRASKLELAELTPLSQPFGQQAKRNGRLSVYDYGEWIYSSIVEAKEVKYRRNGIDIEAIILALYLTHTEFLPSENVINCLRQLCKERGCSFEAVFVLATNGSDLRWLSLVHPYPLGFLPPSDAFKGLTLSNLTMAEGDHGDVVWVKPYDEVKR